MDQPILSVDKLSVSFRTDDGWRTVVRDVSFDVAAKETVALVGESGSGKSVTALSAMGLTPSGSLVLQKQVERMLRGPKAKAFTENFARLLRFDILRIGTQSFGSLQMSLR